MFAFSFLLAFPGRTTAQSCISDMPDMSWSLMYEGCKKVSRVESSKVSDSKTMVGNIQLGINREKRYY